MSARTNRIIGGVAPSSYLRKLEEEFEDNGAAELNARLTTHLIDPTLLRADDFTGFMDARRGALVGMIEKAIGKSVITASTDDGGEEIDDDPEALELD